MLNRCDDYNEGSEAGEDEPDVSRSVRPKNSDGALLVDDLEEFVDSEAEADHGESRSNPSHKSAFGSKLVPVQCQYISEFEICFAAKSLLAYATLFRPLWPLAAT